MITIRRDEDFIEMKSKPITFYKEVFRAVYLDKEFSRTITLLNIPIKKC